jgi:hypothetical protein
VNFSRAVAGALNGGDITKSIRKRDRDRLTKNCDLCRPHRISTTICLCYLKLGEAQGDAPMVGYNNRTGLGGSPSTPGMGTFILIALVVLICGAVIIAFFD